MLLIGKVHKKFRKFSWIRFSLGKMLLVFQYFTFLYVTYTTRAHKFLAIIDDYYLYNLVAQNNSQIPDMCCRRTQSTRTDTLKSSTRSLLASCL